MIFIPYDHMLTVVAGNDRNARVVLDICPYHHKGAHAMKVFKFVGTMICIMGIVVAGYGFSFLLQKNELEKNGIIAKGTVVDINKKDIYRAPFVRFKTKDNRTVTFLSKLDVNVDLFKYRIGQEVEVIYNKNNPNEAEINSFWEKNAAQVYLGALGIFLLLLGLFLIRKGRRKTA